LAHGYGQPSIISSNSTGSSSPNSMSLPEHQIAIEVGGYGGTPPDHLEKPSPSGTS
jgi:hypothetical protein